MPHNVQAQAGFSLTDIYDVRGGQAPIERIETNVVAGVHELGQVIASEQLAALIRIKASGDKAQDANASANISSTPVGAFRIQGITVSVDTASRIARAVVSVRTQATNVEMPIWVWDGTNTDTVPIDVGAGLVDLLVLRPIVAYNQIPTLSVGEGQPQSIGDIICRFRTSSFGAGTVEVTLMTHLTFFQGFQPSFSSKGLPIPSW